MVLTKEQMWEQLNGRGLTKYDVTSQFQDRGPTYLPSIYSGGIFTPRVHMCK